MSENGRAGTLIKQAERLGLDVSYDSGFLVVTHAAGQTPRRDDAAETEQATIEQLGDHLGEAFSLAVARARGVRGSDFLGRQVFIAGPRIVGTLTDCAANGTVTVSYHLSIDQDRTTNPNYSGPGEGVIVIVDGDEQPVLASSIAFPWISSDKVRALLERAESDGLRLEHDSGFIVVKWPVSGNTERAAVEATIREIGRSMQDVSSHLVAVARGVRGKDFVGRPIYFPEAGAYGVLKSCGIDGKLEVTYQSKDLDSRLTCHCNGDRLLILDAGAGKAVEAPSSDQKSEASWRNLLRRAFRG